MKILITGGNYGLGKSINETLLERGHDTSLLGSIDSYAHHLPNIIGGFDVFINNEYRDKIQTDLFEYVYKKWESEKKTIVNILTSAIIFGTPNIKYLEDKKDLESKTFELRTNSKEVRVINIYPNTLESSKAAPNQKLKFMQVSNVISYAIELPHDIELFSIGISKTKLSYDFKHI